MQREPWRESIDTRFALTALSRDHPGQCAGFSAFDGFPLGVGQPATDSLSDGTPMPLSRQVSTTSQRPQTAFASSIWTRAGPVVADREEGLRILAKKVALSRHIVVEISFRTRGLGPALESSSARLDRGGQVGDAGDGAVAELGEHGGTGTVCHDDRSRRSSCSESRTRW